MVIAHVNPQGSVTMDHSSGPLALSPKRMPVVRIAGTPETTPDLEATIQPLVDLSHSGCAVQTTDVFRRGDEFYLAFSVSDYLQFLIPVRVSYSRPALHAIAGQPPYLTGFEYDTVRQPDVHRVIEILLEATDTPMSVH